MSFTGTWKLDAALSTDTGKALAQILPHPRGKRHGGDDDGGGFGELQTGGPQGGGQGGGGAFGLSGETFRAPIDISLQKSLLSGGDYLQIEQRDGEFVVSNGETTESYLPGENSVVSIPNGVADRRSGWKKKEYWVELEPEYGPRVKEKFRLEDGGKRLVETIEVASDGRVRRLEVTRVYEPTSDVPPAPLPLGN